MITTRTKNENYSGYLILEIIMVAVVTFIGTAILVFYATGKSDVRRKTQHLEYFFVNTLFFALICMLPALLAVILLLYFRNRNYIIGYQFDELSSTLFLQFRGLMNRRAQDISIPYSTVYTRDFCEKKFLFNQTYKGKSIMLAGEKRTLDFVTNNFIWEEQPREKIYFLQELERISLINKTKE